MWKSLILLVKPTMFRNLCEVNHTNINYFYLLIQSPHCPELLSHAATAPIAQRSPNTKQNSGKYSAGKMVGRPTKQPAAILLRLVWVFLYSILQDNSGQMTAVSLFLCSPAIHKGDQRTSYIVRATRQSPRRRKLLFPFWILPTGCWVFMFLCEELFRLS